MGRCHVSSKLYLYTNHSTCDNIRKPVRFLFTVYPSNGAIRRLYAVQDIITSTVPQADSPCHAHKYT